MRCPGIVRSSWFGAILAMMVIAAWAVACSDTHPGVTGPRRTVHVPRPEYYWACTGVYTADYCEWYEPETGTDSN